MRVTNCIKPCKYKEYKVVGENRQTTLQSQDFSFSLWAISKNTEVKREELIYPFSSFLAEFGGILGLFLGFSFMSLWDQIWLMCVSEITFRIFCYNVFAK